MVRKRVLVAVLAITFVVAMSARATAQTRQYHLDHEWVKIWINQDGTIDLFYNITLALDVGKSISYVFIGQPKGDFAIGAAVDQYGNALVATDASSGSEYRVNVTLHSPLTAGQAVWFTLTTNVAKMVYEDTQNAGNVGMQFSPVWWPDASVLDLRVSIVLPSGVNTSMVKTSVDWNNVSNETDGRLAVYWERQNLVANQQYSFGVSFPKEYVQHYEGQSSGTDFLQYAPAILIVLFVIGAVVLGVFAIFVLGKKAYMLPTLSMETLGVKHGLTAVEASYLLDMKPAKIVTEILYSLLQKRAVWVESAKPSIKLKIMQPFQNKTGTAENPLRYYEIDFLEALKEDGTLDEEKLAQMIMALRDNVEEQLRGYCRRDTIGYYTKIVSKAWEQVEQAGTPELASNAYDEQLLWLLLDPNYQPRTQTVFRDKAFEPNPMWLWFWYGYRHYDPHPTYRPNIETPAQSAKPPTIPGADFANGIATAVENTSNSIVVNLEKFANAILPMPAGKASNEPAHQNADCVCACAACACVCACVSCACACAGGGVG